MRVDRAVRGALLAGVAVSLMPVGAALASSSSQVKVVERATTDAVLDAGAKGDSPGDVLTFANDLYDEANATKIGTNNGWCVRTVTGKAWECSWTSVLEKGQIMVTGTFNDGKDSTLAIIGGTGKFKKARGEMLLHPRDAQGSAYDFTFKLGR